MDSIMINTEEPQQHTTTDTTLSKVLLQEISTYLDTESFVKCFLINKRFYATLFNHDHILRYIRELYPFLNADLVFISLPQMIKFIYKYPILKQYESMDLLEFQTVYSSSGVFQNLAQYNMANVFRYNGSVYTTSKWDCSNIDIIGAFTG